MPQPYGTGTDISQFIAAATSIIADTDIAQDYANKFNRNTLLEYFSAGIFSDTLHLPIRLADQRIIWCYQKVSISRNPVTGDVEAIVSLKDADRDIRMDYFYKNIIRGDYELVASIDTKTGYLTIVSESVSHGLPDLYGKVTHYMDNLALRINALVAPEHVETSKEAMSLSTILEKLEGPEDYYLTIPAKANLEGNPFAFHWRFGYVGGSKTNILFTRRSFKMSKEKKEQNGI